VNLYCVHATIYQDPKQKLHQCWNNFQNNTNLQMLLGFLIVLRKKLPSVPQTLVSPCVRWRMNWNVVVGPVFLAVMIVGVEATAAAAAAAVQKVKVVKNIFDETKVGTELEVEVEVEVGV
jgi:hypothetical protein